MIAAKLRVMDADLTLRAVSMTTEQKLRLMKNSEAFLEVLYEALELLEDYSDVDDGPDGEPSANRAMQMCQTITEAIEKATGEKLQ